MDIRDEVAAWRQEARQMIPLLRTVAAHIRDGYEPEVGDDLDLCVDRLMALLDKAPAPKRRSSSYTVAENRWTAPRVLRNG